MQVLPATTFEQFVDTLGMFVTQNVGVVIAVIALGVGIIFVIRWFNDHTGQTAVGRWINDQRNKSYRD